MVKSKVIFAVAAIMALPTASFALCSYGAQKEASLSCAEGMVWDAETESCVSSTS